MFNKIILVGNLTRDIELRYTNGGTALAKTAIATTRKFTSNGERKEEVCFVDITFFGRSAEVANQYLRKGSKCLVEGRLMFEQWTDQAGQKRSKHSVTVESMQMLDTKDNNPQSRGYDAPQGQGHTEAPSYQGHESIADRHQPQTTAAQANEEYKASQTQGTQQSDGSGQQSMTYKPQTSIPDDDIDGEIPF